MKTSTLFLRAFRFSNQIIKTTSDQLTTHSQPSAQFVRLSKWISQQSICSRREAEQIIKLGLVRVNGKRIFENQLIPVVADFKTFTSAGIRTSRPVSRLWMINKPRGCICAHKDPQNRPTVYSLLPPSIMSCGYIMSVGRLDFNSQGLLLLTNDSTLKQLLENPEAKLQRFYRVKVHGRVTDEKIEKMRKPMTIKGQQYGPLKVDVKRQLSTNVWMNVSMMTGKNREIRRIMQKCDLEVNKLIRVGYGPYQLKQLPLREIIELEISENLERKMKKVKAEQINPETKTLIEIDIREKAIRYAHLEQKKDKQGELGAAGAPQQIQENQEDQTQEDQQ